MSTKADVAKTPKAVVESQVYGSKGTGSDVDSVKGKTPESTLQERTNLPMDNKKKNPQFNNG